MRLQGNGVVARDPRAVPRGPTRVLLHMGPASGVRHVAGATQVGNP